MNSAQATPPPQSGAQSVESVSLQNVSHWPSPYQSLSPHTSLVGASPLAAASAAAFFSWARLWSPGPSPVVFPPEHAANPSRSIKLVRYMVFIAVVLRLELQQHSCRGEMC